MRIMIVLLLSLATGAHAQGISHSTVLVAADDYTDEDVQVSYSIGEPFTEYLSAAGIALSQGFQQDPAILLDVEYLPMPERMTMSVYPNPAHGRATVRLTGRSDASIRVVDLLGRERAVFEYPHGSTGIELPLQRLEPGMYILQVVAGTNTAGSTRLLNLRP